MMHTLVNSSSAAALFETVETALAMTGLPEFNSVDYPDQVEVLKYLPCPTQTAEPQWALVLTRTHDEEFVVLDVELVRLVLLSFFRAWLCDRGFQVQVHCLSNGLKRWVLVDCLSPADGGGDRLDVDYPYGPDELPVLVQSIIAVNTLYHH